MKKGWKVKKLGEVCQILNGGTPDTKKAEFWDGEHLWITPKDLGKLNSMYVDQTERKITDEGLKNSSAKIIPINSVILSSRAPIGHLAINTKEMSTNQGCKGLVPQKELLTLFLFYFLKKSVEYLNSIGSGTTFKELSGSKLSEVEIPIPPISEQQEIVRIIDEAFDGINTIKANTEKNLQNARELFESYLQNIFANPGIDWDIKKLGEVSKINYGYTAKASFENNNIKFLRITDIQNNQVNWQTVPFCEIEKEVLPKYILSDGDIVFARTGATTGKSFLLKDPPLSVFASYLIRLKILNNKILLPSFLILFFQTKSYWDKISTGLSGSTQGGFNATKLSEMLIPIPSVVEQKAIVKKLDQLSTETKRLEKIYQQKLTDLEELKKSILQQAFNGELT